MDKKDVNDLLCLSDGGIREHAYLISRGVRSIAIFNLFPADPLTMLEVSTRLETLALCYSNAIPFVVDLQNGEAIAGYGVSKEMIETYLWTMRNVPSPHRDRVLGVLHGYAIPAIEEFERGESIRQFDQSSLMSDVSDERASRSQPHEHFDMVETFPLR